MVKVSCIYTYQAKWGLGDPSVAVQVRLTDWPSLRVWFLGRPVISGGLGGSEKVKKEIEWKILRVTKDW